MRKALQIVICLLAFALLGAYGWCQSNPPTTTPATPQESVLKVKKPDQPGKEVGKGGEDIGKGVAKGTGDLAKGTADSVGHIAQGNFGSAGASFGRGVGELGKNVTVGTAKGVGKIAKGIGGALKKL